MHQVSGPIGSSCPIGRGRFTPRNGYVACGRPLHPLPETRIWPQHGGGDAIKNPTDVLFALQERLLSTTEVFSTLGGRVKSDLRADEVPPLLVVVGKAGELEVVYIDSQNQLKVFVIVETLPARDGGETHGK